MKCNYCGTDNPEQARFCGICGKKLVRDEGEGPVTPSQEIDLSIPGRKAPEQEGVQVGNASTPPLKEVPFFEAWPATPVGVSPATRLDTEADHHTEFPSPLSSSAPIWPFAGLNQESSNYPPEEEQVPPPPPGWPIFQESRGAHSKTQPGLPARILKPWPRPVFYGIIAALVLIMVLLIATGSDWADGAVHAAIAATIITLLLICVLTMRLIMGRVAQTSAQRRAQYMSTGLLILVLLLLIGSALAFQPALHTVQGRSLEQSRQWEQAIIEYQLGGDSAPTSVNIARAYNEWGEDLVQKQHYQQAIDQFEMVLNRYNVTGSQVGRAQNDEINARTTLGKLDQQKQDYNGAVAQFDALLQLKFCDAQCQKDGQALDAAAYYNLAKFQLVNGQYSSAVANFTALQQRFSTSPDYKAAHGDMAKALFGLGNQQISAGNCPAAVPNYQQLAKAFSDTKQGKNAAVALKAPQSVEGRFTRAVPRGHALAVLTQGLAARAWKDQIYTVLAHHPPVATILANGTFRFKPLKQGTYDLSWGDIASNGNEKFNTIFIPKSGAYYYVAHVGPLCPFNFGNIALGIPKAS